MTSNTSPTCFVISPFGEPYDTYFVSVVKPALDECNVLAIRGDSPFRPSSIMDDIWSDIQGATLLIAELTTRNPNVFYELGLAHALSKPVILLSETIEDVPFDLRAIRVILYDKNHPEWGQKLKSQLVKSINEVMASPSLSIPSTFKVAVVSEKPEVSEAILRIERLENQISRLADDLDYSDDHPLFNNNLEHALTKPAIRFGQSVFHPKFGPGIVMEISIIGTIKRVKVNFLHAGIKTLNEDTAQLLLIDSILTTTRSEAKSEDENGI
jgi:hypothetical protein